MNTDLEHKIEVTHCVWYYDEEMCYYETECGKAFAVIEGTPGENGFRFCPYCGKEPSEKYEELPFEDDE